MNRGVSIFTTAVIATFVVSGAQAAPVSRDDFQAGTTGNLVALCGAAETDPLYTAAINFCHGFVVATYRAVTTEEAASKSKLKLFCLPPNPPNRNQAIAAFVTWANGHPTVLAESPTDGAVEYLHAQYPCQ